MLCPQLVRKPELDELQLLDELNQESRIHLILDLRSVGLILAILRRSDGLLLASLDFGSTLTQLGEEILENPNDEDQVSQNLIRRPGKTAS